MAVPVQLGSSTPWSSSAKPAPRPAGTATAAPAPGPGSALAAAPVASTGGVATPQPTQLSAEANPQLQDVFNTAKGTAGAPDPLLMENVQNLRNRMGADVSERATNRAGARIADMAAGAKQSAKERSAAMGGGEAAAGARIDDATLRAQASAAADIALGNEQRLDNLTLGGQDIFASPGGRQLQALSLAGSTAGSIAGQQLGEKNLQLSAAESSQRAAQAAAQMELQRQQIQAELAAQNSARLMSEFSTLYGMGVSPSNPTAAPASSSTGGVRTAAPSTALRPAPSGSVRRLGPGGR